MQLDVERARRYPARCVTGVVRLTAQLPGDRAREHHGARDARHHRDRHHAATRQDSARLLFLCVGDGDRRLLHDFATGFTQQYCRFPVYAVDRPVRRSDIEPRRLELDERLTKRLAHLTVKHIELLDSRADFARRQFVGELFRIALRRLFILLEGAPVFVELRGILAAHNDVLTVLHLILESNQSIRDPALLRAIYFDKTLVGIRGVVHLHNAEHARRRCGQ
ncbi:hypothetical protein [Paraburkholderia sprentiae]|nr:hypothetical protein [Paraburkholderia sprentiae]